MVRRVVRWGLGRLGYDVVRTGLEGWTATKLSALCQPRTIIDVGVCEGTPELYEAFKSAHLLLIDPLNEAEPHMRRILASRRGDYELVALGADEGITTMNVCTDLSASSLNERPIGSKFQVAGTRQVPVTTLDRVCAGRRLEEPILLKLDTEGHELDVLRGARKTLTRVGCVISEVSVAERFRRSYRFAELVTELDNAGFALADVMTVRRGDDTLATRIDAAFIKT